MLNTKINLLPDRSQGNIYQGDGIQVLLVHGGSDRSTTERCRYLAAIMKTQISAVPN